MPQPRARPNLRPDHNGTQRAQFESHKKKIYATQKVCGICGKPVDFGMKFPHFQQVIKCKNPTKRTIFFKSKNKISTHICSV